MEDPPALVAAKFAGADSAHLLHPDDVVHHTMATLSQGEFVFKCGLVERWFIGQKINNNNNNI